MLNAIFTAELLDKPTFELRDICDYCLRNAKMANNILPKEVLYICVLDIGTCLCFNPLFGNLLQLGRTFFEHVL